MKKLEKKTSIPAKEYWKIGHDGEDTPFITMASAKIPEYQQKLLISIQAKSEWVKML